MPGPLQSRAATLCRRLSRVCSAVLLSLLVLPAVLQAQETGSCRLLDDPNRTVDITNRNTPYETWFVTDAVFDCPGGRRFSARSATYMRAGGQFTLDGNVRVDEPDRSLRSEFAQYFSETRQMHARTNVVLRDLRSGSIIESQLLDVYQQGPDRPEDLIIASGGSPRATLFQDTREGGRDSTLVDAQEIRILGEQSFRATGNAVMRRDSLTAHGNTIDYTEEGGRLEVAGQAQIQLPTQQLSGDSVTATLTADNEVSDVLARHNSALQTEDLNVTAPGIRLLFENGGVTRMVAMSWEPAAGAAPGARPVVVSEEFRMESDSIDVLAPGQQLTEAVAIGNARGERILPDSIRALLPEAAPEVLALLSSDWMRGDTVRARFIPNPAAETDTTAAATVMEQLSAHGEQAQSMYSVRDQNDPQAQLSFNYLLASYIEVNFADGTVATVAASGDATGVYLQPADAARAVTGTTISAAPGARRR